MSSNKKRKIQSKFWKIPTRNISLNGIKSKKLRPTNGICSIKELKIKLIQRALNNLID